MQSNDISPDRCDYPANQDHPAYHTGASSIPGPYGLSFGDSRWGQDASRKQKVNPRGLSNYGPRQRGSGASSDAISPNGPSSSSSHPRSYSHGQAEQLRRSRESTTFALIDNQLSKPPLSQVRDLYLQNRVGSSSSNSAPTRTTKKANLSAVHTIVRFRTKDILIPLLAHVRRMVDIYFEATNAACPPGARDALASQCFGVCQLPCSLSCEFCDHFKSQVDRQIPSRKMVYSKNLVPVKSSPCKSSYPPPPPYRGSMHDERMCMRSNSPAEPMHPNRRYVIPPPQQQQHQQQPNFIHRPAMENDLDPIDDVVVPNSPDVKPEGSANTSPLSSPSSPLLNLEAFDHASETEFMDDIQNVVDEVSSMAFPPVQNILDDAPLAKRNRVDSNTIRLQDLMDMPLGMNFDLDEDPAELHNLLTGNPDFKLEPFADETTTMNTCDDLEALSRLPLLEGLGRADDCELPGLGLKPECPSPQPPPQTPSQPSSSSSCVSQHLP